MTPQHTEEVFKGQRMSYDKGGHPSDAVWVFLAVKRGDHALHIRSTGVCYRISGVG